jgi:8-amino-7-oxononanoate synthase
MDLFEKCLNFKTNKEMEAAGFWPYFHPIEEASGTEAVMRRKRLIMLGSNNYLGLTQHPKVKEAAKAAIDRYGSGCTGSRFLNGTLDLHEQLEERLAKFLEKEAALVFTTGFLTNQGTIAPLVGPEDYVLGDRQNHASIVEGYCLSGGKVKKFRHNDMTDLERKLSHCEREAGKLIVVDGVFSMEGDIVKLPTVVRHARHYGARVMVDDAHAIGILGGGGRGTGDHYDLLDDIDIVMATFSKSFASLGGFIAGNEHLINFIKCRSRAFIFSASLPPGSAAAALAALEIIEDEPERRERLLRNADRLRNGLKRSGFDTLNSQTPIIPILIGNDELTCRFWRKLFDNGVYANAALSPAVPPGRSRIRTSCTATHTEEQLDKALEIIESTGKELGIIQ